MIIRGHSLGTEIKLCPSVTQNIAQYPLRHVTYAATKFEVAKANSLGGDTNARSRTQSLSNSYTMGCPPVRGDNPQALASGLSYVQVDKHGIIILYHLH